MVKRRGKNKKAWIRIIEAVIAVVILMGVIFAIVESSKINITSQQTILNQESGILLGVEINQTLRGEILTETAIPTNSNETSFPSQLGNYLNQKTPKNLNCLLSICQTNTTCIYENNIKKSLYVKDVLITATKNIYNPRILKIFCYTK